MLVLSRKETESVTITDTETGEEIIVTVTTVRGDKAKLGFDASQRFRILRTELIDQDEAADDQQGIVPVVIPSAKTA